MGRKQKPIYRQIIYDIKNGTISNYKLLLLYSLLLIIFCLSLISKVKACLPTSLLSPCFTDYCIELWKGKEIIKYRSVEDYFAVPGSWLLLQGFILITFSAYPKADYVERGYQFFIRAGNKKTWWASKTIWIFFHTVLCYFYTYIILFLLSGCRFGDFDNDRGIVEAVIGIVLPDMSLFEIIGFMVVMPVLVTASLGMAGMVVAILVSTNMSVIVNFCWLIVSFTWCSEFFVGNYIMLLRNERVVGDEGVSMLSGLFICTAIIMLCFFGGGYLFERLDVFGGRKY